MIGRLVALGAAAAAAVAGAGAAVWARRRSGEETSAKEGPRGVADVQDGPRPAQSSAPPASSGAPPAASGAPSGSSTAPLASPGASVVLTEPETASMPIIDGDDLTALRGIGAVSAERLRGIGVTTFAQIAAWSDGDIEDIGARIKISAERIRREDWVGQARETSEG